MATTRTALQNGEGPRLHFVLAIEGISAALTDGPAAAALTAWAAAPFTSMLGGLQINGSIEQTLKPWEPTIDVGRLSFGVHDDNNADTFGILVGGTGAGVETYLDAALGCTDTTVTVDSTAAFATSGHIFIGVECIAYTGKAATSFTGCTRGMFAPFQAATGVANRFGRAHPLPGIGDGQNTVIRPKVTSLPRVWTGRTVGLWAHRVVADVLDTKAEAQCIWAGRVLDTKDDARGMTILECEDIRGAIRDCMLLRDRWSCKVKEGIYLRTGYRFQANDHKNGSGLVANNLLVVASGATGAATGQINAGYYTVDTLATELNTWLNAETAAARLNFSWTMNPRYVPDGGTVAWRIKWTNGHATAANGAAFIAPSYSVRDFMGFDNDQHMIDGSHWTFNGDTSHSVVSPFPPTRVMAADDGTFEIDDIKGKWENNQPYWPSGVGYPTDYVGDTSGTQSFAILQFGSGGPMAVYQGMNSATAPTEIRRATGGNSTSFLAKISGVEWATGGAFTGIAIDDDRDLTLKQVWIHAGGMTSLISQLLASTGYAAYNHLTRDTLPAQLGAAIPWEALGSTWTLSCGAVDGADNDSIMLVIDKPTKLTEILACEFVSRMASIVLKPAAGGSWGSTGGIIKAASWGTPVASLATFTLNETNKAVPIDTGRELHRTTSVESRVALVNHVKLEYNRDLTGGYRDSITIVCPGSIADLGVTRGPTISMRNSFSASGASSSGIERIKDGLISAMEMFSRPMRTLSRTIDQSLFDGVAPGDFGSISDNFARDPSTGARSLSSKACLLIQHHYDFGGYEIDAQRRRNQRGTVEVLILQNSNVTAYSPCAMVDIAAATGGYVAATRVLTCLAHSHSHSTEVADATRFVAGDKVRVIEINPDSPAAPETWLDTVASQTGNTITLTTGLAGWTATKYHRVIPDAWSVVATTQKTKAFIADDADSLIATGVNAFTYGHTPQQSETVEPAGTGSGPARLYATASYAVGAPYDVGYEEDAALLVNTLVRKRTAPNMPQMYRTAIAAGTTAFTRKVIERRILHLGPGNLGSGTRLLRLAPMLRRGAAGAAVTMRATLCRAPVSGSSWTITDANNPGYQLNGPMSATVTWSTATTTWAVGAVQSVSLAPVDSLTGLVWLIVEAEPNIEYKGMSECWDLGFAQASDP